MNGSPRNRRSHSQTRREGYVLLLTLLAIAISSLLLIGFAQFSMNHAIEMIMVKDELQRKWGAASVQRCCLEQSNKILNPLTYDSASGENVSTPLRQSESVIQLGEFRFEVQLNDESAKADLNQLLAAKKNIVAAEAVAEKLVGSGQVNLHFRPLPGDKRRTLKESAFESWDQVFESSGDSLSPDMIRSATSQITCWSSKLNYKTATDDVLYEVCSAVGGPAAAGQLVAQRRREPNMKLQDALNEIHATKNSASQIRKVIGEGSQSQSIWIVVSDQVSENHYFVVQESISGVRRYSGYQW